VLSRTASKPRTSSPPSCSARRSACCSLCSRAPVYGFYKDAPQLWGLSDLADQQIAGVTMAAEQAIVFFAVFAHYFLRFLRTEQIAGVFSESPR
jgi:cytochrome c oxidase assembly factor CtaG